jgi:hypothetical protein
MIGETINYLRPRWLAVLLSGLLWVTMGSMAALAARIEFGHSPLAENSASARVFWSGGDEARLAAEASAKQTRGVTLEMTAAGQRLQQITKGMDWADAKPLWEAASADFARGATGTVNVFQNGTRGVSLESVWRGASNILCSSSKETGSSTT